MLDSDWLEGVNSFSTAAVLTVSLAVLQITGFY